MAATKTKTASSRVAPRDPHNIPVERKFYTDFHKHMEVPDLIEIQKYSYDWFFEEGLKELFDEVGDIQDFGERGIKLRLLDYHMDEAKFDETTSKEKNVTYEAPLRVTAEIEFRDGKKQQQEIYLGDFPLMTDRGTFIINGIERVVVSQIIRSAGVFFTSEMLRGKRFYGAKIIPNRGAWLEVETDANNVLWVKIDRKRKVALTSLFRAFGYGTDEEIMEIFKDVDTHPDVRYIEQTLKKDVAGNEEEGLIEVYKRIRPGDLATADNAKSLIHSMFFNFDRYDFGRVGRYKINNRFGYDIENTPDNRVLRREDLIDITKEVIKLNNSQAPADDIDHLSNRRVRAVGELIQNKIRIGLARMIRIVRDRMSTMDMDSMSPSRLINARPVIGVVKEFFMSSQLSQFMDQTNPLAELEHKRRISAMGPGGLSRERAGFEVRDVHTTHYGRICPIATPEGPNIGLVGHLASYARTNEYGFIETPYRVVEKKLTADVEHPVTKKILKKGTVLTKQEIDALREAKVNFACEARVTDEVVYLNALHEERSITTAANTLYDPKTGAFTNEKGEVRLFGKPTTYDLSQVDYMDVASNQIVSISTSLIPFLEHDDAVRALMGTNMQRQAVPCIKPQAPYVGTGVEKMAAYYSGHVVIAPEAGEITAVDGNKIELTTAKGDVHTFVLNKYRRSNASTAITQHPTIKLGEKVKRGQVLSDGPSISDGELALGQNVLVTFLSWQGYNYEDAVILSEKMVRDDRYTSIHIEHYQIEVRETKLGSEIITSDIPNVGEDKLKNLDENGIIRVGAEVSSGDILVGKITPKGESELSAEERLLRAIFGEKARDVRDSSLILEHGDHGKVVDVKRFSAENGDKLSPGVIEMIQVSVADIRKIQVGDKMAGRHGNKGVISKIVPLEDMPFLEDGTPVDIILSPLGVVSRMNLGQILETHLGLAIQKLGFKIATPVLYGVKEGKIQDLLEEAGYPRDGKMQLYDGRTGEPFDEKTTVGYKYFLKLSHMIEDKMHQRSIGPYSLITQQPLGGKAQFGGQRFGEMEVWALEGYGAAHTLQEILTIKSDDIQGRSKAYESIIKGEPIEELSIPESFNVLVRELKGLALDVELLNNGKVVKDILETEPKHKK
jgi:DNA-directed RNA polymerase subunit beta